MARDGYPDPADRLYYEQAFLDTIIEAHNSKRKGDNGKWNTDPQGLRSCLEVLSSAPVNWVQCSSTHRDETQTFIQRCVRDAGFPTPVLTNEGRHWVLVVGWEMEATHPGGHAALKHVHYYDPKPDGIGADRTVTAREWKTKACFSTVAIKGTWVKHYVAVGQLA